MTAGNATMVPQSSLKSLTRADGSATYSDQLYSILAGVNGPVEVQRRDELPAEAAIEINLRPLSGTGGPRERWIESVLQTYVQSILLVHLHPRTLVQVTLQVTKQPESGFGSKEDVAILPALINAAFLALVDAALPLRTTAVAILLAIDERASIKEGPNEKDMRACQSLHALAYDVDGTLLLQESVGKFDEDQWDEVTQFAQARCLAAINAANDEDSMTDVGSESYPWLRQVLQEKVVAFNAWRDDS